MRMEKFKVSLDEINKRRKMFFGESLTIDREEITDVANAAQSQFVSQSEIRFIERLKLGEESAFNELVDSYSPDIFALLMRLTNNSEDAHDLTQETFLRVLRSIKSFRGDSGLKTWLFRIAINESKNRWRWWKRRKLDFIDSIDAENEFSERSIRETLASDSPTPEAVLLQSERESHLNKALAELPVAFREVVILRDIEGMQYEEIAVALSTNVGTVKSRLSRGREDLRKRLKGF
jgi:RNA polymerase sigma-70 factor, ECF subfamily